MVSDCGSPEVWLCGRTFTAADLNVTILILRLKMLGLVSRYFTPSRPNLCEYQRRLMERPPAKKLSKMGGTLAKTLMKKGMNAAAKFVFKAGAVVAVVGVGVYIYRKYNH